MLNGNARIYDRAAAVAITSLADHFREVVNPNHTHVVPDYLLLFARVNPQGFKPERVTAEKGQRVVGTRIAERQR